MTPDRVERFRVTVSPQVPSRVHLAPAAHGFVLVEFASNVVPLRDFEWTRVRLAVVASGSQLVDVPPIFRRDGDGHVSFRFDSRFTAGLIVRPFEEVALDYDGPEPVTVTVGALRTAFPPA